MAGKWRCHACKVKNNFRAGFCEKCLHLKCFLCKSPPPAEVQQKQHDPTPGGTSTGSRTAPSRRTVSSSRVSQDAPQLQQRQAETEQEKKEKRRQRRNKQYHLKRQEQLERDRRPLPPSVIPEELVSATRTIPGLKEQLAEDLRRQQEQEEKEHEEDKRRSKKRSRRTVPSLRVSQDAPQLQPPSAGPESSSRMMPGLTERIAEDHRRQQEQEKKQHEEEKRRLKQWEMQRKKETYERKEQQEPMQGEQVPGVQQVWRAEQSQRQSTRPAPSLGAPPQSSYGALPYSSYGAPPHSSYGDPSQSLLDAGTQPLYHIPPPQPRQQPVIPESDYQTLSSPTRPQRRALPSSSYGPPQEMEHPEMMQSLYVSAPPGQ
ncbi:MAG: hypothetical protein Q9222_006051 [Ikaeria aurantiellina]